MITKNKGFLKLHSTQKYVFGIEYVRIVSVCSCQPIFTKTIEPILGVL